MTKLKRPQLNKIELKDAWQAAFKPGFTITVSPGQWDAILEEAYFRQGATLIEIDESGMPIAAYKYDKTK